MALLLPAGIATLALTNTPSPFVVHGALLASPTLDGGACGGFDPATCPNPVTLEIDRDGGLNWNCENIKLSDAKVRMAKIARQWRQPDVMIVVDDRTSYREFVRVYSAVRNSGLKHQTVSRREYPDNPDCSQTKL